MNRTGRILSAVGLAIALGMGASGCVVRAQGEVGGGGMYATEAPPPPMQEQYETRAGYVWVGGHYQWEGGRYVWQPGRYERERAGYAWQQGQWVNNGGQWRYTEGTWIVANGVPVSASMTTSGEVVADHPVVDRNGRPLGGGAPPVAEYPVAPPPPVQVENPGMRAGYVWVSGYYQWQGGAYAWTPGHWERERANMIWQPGRWELRGDRYVWVEGNWVAGAPANPRDHRH
jgi:hypothetical protein